MLDTAGLLASAFEELGKDKSDPDCIAATKQQAFLFLGNANPILAMFTMQKYWNSLTQWCKALLKTLISLNLHPTYSVFGQGIEHKIKEHVDTVFMLKSTTTAELKPRNLFEGASLNQAGQGGAGTRHKPTISPTTQAKEVPVQEEPS